MVRIETYETLLDQNWMPTRVQLRRHAHKYYPGRFRVSIVLLFTTYVKINTYLLMDWISVTDLLFQWTNRYWPIFLCPSHNFFVVHIGKRIRAIIIIIHSWTIAPQFWSKRLFYLVFIYFVIALDVTHVWKWQESSENISNLWKERLHRTRLFRIVQGGTKFDIRFVPDRTSSG